MEETESLESGLSALNTNLHNLSENIKKFVLCIDNISRQIQDQNSKINYIYESFVKSNVRDTNSAIRSYATKHKIPISFVPSTVANNDLMD